MKHARSAKACLGATGVLIESIPDVFINEGFGYIRKEYN